VDDLYLSSEGWGDIIQTRDGVAIDRDSEKAKDRLKYDFEVVPASASFDLRIVLENATPQDLQLISVGLSEFVHGFGVIGGKRSRGLGQIKASISDQATSGRPGGFVTSTLRASQEPPEQLWGLGRWLNEPREQGYGTWPDDLLDFKALDLAPEQINHGIRSMRAFSGPAFQTLREAAIQDVLKRIADWPAEPTTLGAFAANRR
jgi:hypothetical protein